MILGQGQIDMLNLDHLVYHCAADTNIMWCDLLQSHKVSEVLINF